MATRAVGKEARKLEGALRAAAQSGIKQGEVQARITPNFTYITYGFRKGYRYVALEGSSRSGKTWAALQWIIFAALNPKEFIKDFKGEKLTVRCARLEAANARDSIFRDFNEIMDLLGLRSGFGGFSLNKTTMEWVFPNGSTISFCGASDGGKLHGIGQDIVFFNEVMMIPKTALDQSEFRTRYGFIFDWNPSLNDHWIFKMGFDKTGNYGEDAPKALVGKPRCLYAHSTYKDNCDLETGESNLTPFQIAGIEQYEPTAANIARGTADRYLWEVYGLGKRGYLEGRVVGSERVDVIPDEEFPDAKQWELHGYGLDWGFSNDPTALIECAIFNKKLYVREIIYEKGLMISPDLTLGDAPSVIGRFREKGISQKDVIVADAQSSTNMLNAALRNAGYNVVDAYKPAGSLENGINLLNQRRWCVTDSSFNIKFELENYVWARTRTGEQKRVPIDKFNHAIDAIRYWVSTFIDSGNVLKVSKFDEDLPDGGIVYGCIMDEW